MKFRRKFRYNNKQFFTYLFIFVLLAGVTLGYSSLASNLKIDGTVQMDNSTWDVHFSNIVVKEGSVTPTTAPTISNNTSVVFGATLANPGEYYGFTIDIVNNGTFDAMIDSFTITPVLTEAQKKFFTYEVTYSDGVEIANKHKLAKNTTQTYKVLFKYNTQEDVNLYPEENQSFVFNFAVNFVQADNTAINRPVNAITYITRQNEGQITPGDVIGIGETEDFYVISSDSQKTVLLAKYNLLVGNIIEDNGGGVIPLNPGTTQGYGLQSIEAITGYGGHDGKGAVAFADTLYWDGGDYENPNLLSPYNANGASYSGNPYPYVYDENSNIYQYISGENGYVNKLIAMGAPNTITGRLLSYEEAVAAQNIKDNGKSIILNEHRTYWLGSAYGPDEDIFGVWDYYGDLLSFTDESYLVDDTSGVRPVIEISTSDID